MNGLNPPARDRLDSAIRGGLAYLRASQLPNGEWATLTSPHLDLRDGTAYPTSVYSTTFVLHTLASLAPSARPADLIAQAALFLRAEQDSTGLWNYEGRAGQRLYPDLDDTSCAVAALRLAGQQPDFAFFAHLWRCEAAVGGPYYTWVGLNDHPTAPGAREVDPLVNANIVFCCGCLGIEVPGAAAYLRERISAGDYSAKYCVSPHFLLYAISRAYADGRVAGLEASMPALQSYILRELPPPAAEPSVFNLACLAAALLNSRAPGAIAAPYLAVLVDRQAADGSWPAWAAYLGFHGCYDGGPALTTAISLDALAKALARDS